MNLVSNFRENQLEWKILFDCEIELTEDIYPKNNASHDGKWTAF
jgi:hypothetical protein